MIKNSAGTVILSRSPGTAYDASIIFKTFCPTATCPTATTVDYTVSLTDAYGDGWNGVVLGFRQNGTIQNFGQTFTSGAEFPNTIFTYQKLKTVDIIVTTHGLWTEEIGFIVRNRQGLVVFQRMSGTTFDANTILGSFCPECLNLSPVKIVGDS